MSRPVSTTTLAELNAQETGEAFHVLVTIDVPESPSIYMTSDTVETVSRGRTYINYPFALELPSDAAGQISEARMSIDNVDRALMDEIRNLGDPLRLTIEVVANSTPDTVEYSANDFVLRNLSYDALTISGTLSQENFLTEPFPKDIMSARSFPGLF